MTLLFVVPRLFCAMLHSTANVFNFSLRVLSLCSASHGPLHSVSCLLTSDSRSFSTHQIGLDKFVDIAIKHAVDIADFKLGAVVLDHLIGLQNIGANLAAPGDLFL